MTNYYKWTANENQADGSTVLVMKDGTEVRMGEPVQMSNDLRKQLQDSGRVVEQSSAAEAKEFHGDEAVQPVGLDVSGTAPVFADVDQSSNQEVAQEKREANDKK